MSVRSAVIKAIVSFCRVDPDTAFERHRGRIPINCDELETVQSLKKHLLSFLGLRELAIKFGLGEFDLKLYHMAPTQGGRSENFAIITDGQWKMELPSLLEETGSELTLLEQGMRRLHDSIAAANKEYPEEDELCTLLTTVVGRTFTPSPILNMRRSPPYSIPKTLNPSQRRLYKRPPWLLKVSNSCYRFRQQRLALKRRLP